jgi:polycystin 2
MTQLQLTLSRCAKDVAGFAVMFFIVFLAYAQIGFLVFGTQVYDFSSFQFSIYSLFRIILGDFDFEALETANYILGPIFFLTYVFFVFFVLLNMFIAIINDTYGEIKSELSSQKSDIELASFFKKGYTRVIEKLNLKRAKIVDIKKAIKSKDFSCDKGLEFTEWRNMLRSKGYGDTEIETLFAEYDVDGDRCLNQEEQVQMLKKLSEEDDELKTAYMAIQQQKAKNEEIEADKKKKRHDGVLFEDYKFLSSRIDNMDNAIKSIVNKVDMVLGKLDKAQKAREEKVYFDSVLSFNVSLQYNFFSILGSKSKEPIGRDNKRL